MTFKPIVSRVLKFCLVIFSILTICFCNNQVFGQRNRTHLQNSCAFAEVPKTEYKIDNNVNLESFIQRIISSTGFNGDRIFISSSPEIKYAVTGLRLDGNAEIVVNSGFNAKDTSWYNAAIIVHELGHILNRDIYKGNCTAAINELHSDYVAGFWGSKNGAEKKSIQAPFEDLQYEPPHPTLSDRLHAVDSGWNNGKTKFTPILNPGVSLSSSYEKYLNLYFTVSNTLAKASKTHKYKVYFHLTSMDGNIPFDSIAGKIAKVSYVLDQETFKRPLVTSYNKNNDAFGYTLTKVWDTFPVICLVYFTDESILSIVKTFSAIE